MGSSQFTYSPFSPAAARKTSVCLLRNKETGDHRLVTSISTRKSTEVLRINLRTGRLELENDAVSESSYENESEALAQLQDKGFEQAERGSALLGYVVAGPCAGVLLATRSKQKAMLPGGHTVYVVTDSQWVIVPLLNEAADAAQAAAMAGLPPPKGDTEFWRALQQFTLNNAHYYCETADISRPFPSSRDPREPSPEFVWNSWLRQPLVELGLYDHCPALLQGAAECSTLQHPGGGGRFSVCLISRRSRRHPGTRYIARGLNSLAGPGNEIECELLTWTHPEQHQHGGGGSPQRAQRAEPLKWARVVWRRGTVPIWWGVQLQSLAQGLQAEVYVREEHPYQGTASYFRNVQRQHAPQPQLAQPAPPEPAAAGQGGDAAAGPGSSGAGGPGGEGWTLVGGGEGAAGEQQAQQAQQGQQAGGPPVDDELLSRLVPVTCINLLHANPKKASELMLSSHFQDAMRHVRRRLGGDAPIKVVNFDWHGNMGRLSEEKAVEGFWSLMEPFVKQTGFAAGWMEPASAAGAPDSAAASSSAAQPAHGSSTDAVAPASVPAAAPASTWQPGWRMRWSAQQAGVLRFNCADSLDRTNAATCFAMLPVLQEQLRTLGIPLECSVPPATAALLRGRGHSSAGDVAALAGQAAGPSLDELSAALPEGWEVRQHEGRLLYIDHINRTTQWTPPPSPAPSPGGRPPSAGRPSSGAPLSARVMQSASGMLARLQRQAASPGGVGSGGSGGAPRPTPLLSLERRPSPPRSSGPDGDASGGHWARSSGSSGSLSGALMLQEGSVPDASPASARPAAAAAADAADLDPLRPWAFFDYDIDAVRDRLLKEAVDSYVEMFRVHGDIHSFLYTGSPAMHSHVLSLVVQGGKGYGATSGVGKLQNLRVAVQRRWNNTVSDASRQQAMELFLGLRIHDRGDQRGYFPGLQLVYQDSTQAQLGALEACEQAALPPTGAHSRQPSLTTPLAAGAAALHNGEPAVPPTQQQQQQPGPAAQEEDWEGDDDDRAHAVAGVPAVQHDGVLGVQQSLLDLEPLPDCVPEEQRRTHGGSPASPESSATRSARPAGIDAPHDFDPLGALTEAELGRPGQQQRGELIDLDGGSSGAEGSLSAQPVPSADSVRRLQDLLL